MKISISYELIALQDRYRTFTVNGINFGPDIGAFLRNLKARGVKSCTNITPIMTLRESDSDPYQALRNFWNMSDKSNPATKCASNTHSTQAASLTEYSLLVRDNRYTDGLPPNHPLCWRYDTPGYMNATSLDPNSLAERPSFADYIGATVYTDNYVFIGPDRNKQQGNYNSGFPYHGGVSYGTNLGTVSLCDLESVNVTKI